MLGDFGTDTCDDFFMMCNALIAKRNPYIAGLRANCQDSD